MSEETDHIRISTVLKKKLEALKAHPRATYAEVIESLLTEKKKVSR